MEDQMDLLRSSKDITGSFTVSSEENVAALYEAFFAARPVEGYTHTLRFGYEVPVAGWRHPMCWLAWKLFGIPMPSIEVWVEPPPMYIESLTQHEHQLDVSFTTRPPETPDRERDDA